MSKSTAHKLLIANRGKIAVRILRTASHLNIRTVATYVDSDATAPHAVQSDEAVQFKLNTDDPGASARGYLDAEAIIAICKEHAVTLVHHGYGFLSENAPFAQMVADAGIT
ncbi:Pre-ATP-grasp domain-containing protein [Fomes fomentarius]|nr:Pre-ATP-grasp domain-containing protein [Fomes fomentarius]